MSNNTSGGNMGILSILQIIFLVLKLTNLVAWSWPVVLIPFWIGLTTFVLGVIILSSTK